MPQKHTSVIYVHGVGNPRRYLSLTSFLDYFDLYGQRQPKDTVGHPKAFSSKNEILDGEVQRYIEFKKVNSKNGKDFPAKTIKIYEAYWAEGVLSKFGILYIFLWIISRAWLPLRIAFSAWRAFPALRLNVLHRIGESSPRFFKIQKMERVYRDFENWDSRRKHRRGSFIQFIEYLSAKTNDDERADMVKLACEWKNEFNKTTWGTGVLSLFVFSIVISMLLAISLLLLSIFRHAILLPEINVKNEILVIESLLLIIICITALNKIRKYLFDVIAWTMESERDSRFSTRIGMVESTKKLVRHVVNDDKCVECYIIAHSLGASVALEAILHEGEMELMLFGPFVDKDNLSNMSKIRAIFTVGSPIDILFSFFQADKTFSHRYHRLHEDQRKSASLPPFRFGGIEGRAKLINIWSRFDPISSRVFSLRKSVSERASAILNSEALPSGFPFPVRAHTSYFSDPHVMRMIYRAIMLGEIPEGDTTAAKTLGHFRAWLVAGGLMAWLSVMLAYRLSDPRSAWFSGLVCVASIYTVVIWLWRRRIAAVYQRIAGPFLDRTNLDVQSRPS